MTRRTRRWVTLLGISGLLLAGTAIYMALFGAPEAILSLLGEVDVDMPALGRAPPMPPETERDTIPGVRVEEVARELSIPWDLELSPDGRMFVSERDGRIRTLSLDRTGDWVALHTWLDLRHAVHVGEGGVLGLALHPHFVLEPWVYVAYTTEKGDRLVNRVSRFRDEEQQGTEEEVLIDDIPAARFHNGGAVDFGPDGMLYVGTGDARDPPSAQDRQAASGKILRITPDGGIPRDNPWPGSAVWAYGFRNVSALAWHPDTGELWAASHGPSGEFVGLHARDTVYIVEKGGNHGWPLVVGVSERRDLVPPVLYYPDEARPPGGLAFYSGTRLPFTGHLFMTTLRSAHLQHVVFEGDRVNAVERWWDGRFGRLRALAEGPDGALYFSTSNRDGRAGREHPGSDFIYRVVPDA